MDLEEKLALLPDKPGVYLMKDEKGRVLYVGKALVLRKRVRSYFQSSRNQDSKTKVLVSQINDLEYIVTDSELEALILECNLIKEHRPKYNVLLKDSKGYPYLKVTWKESFPRLVVVRQMEKDGSRYFGPYTNVAAMHETTKLLKNLFPLRTCKKTGLGEKTERPCLNYHLKQCLAPCARKVPAEEYREMAKEVCLFLEGRQEKVAKDLVRKMEEAAEKLAFEKAVFYRNQLQAVQKVVERQKIISEGMEDEDILGLALGEKEACAQVFFIRSGKLIGREHFFLQGIEGKDREEILEAFLQQYYLKATFIPNRIYLSVEMPGQDLLEAWLTKQRGKKVSLKVPKKGEKKQLLEMVGKNAQLVLQEETLRLERERERAVGAVEELQQYLALERPPYRIEAFDVSNIQGAQAVGSLVVFYQGKAKKEDYRYFKIKTVEGPNDFAMIAETVRRHYQRVVAENKALPDLILIDGGKGQLGAAREVLRELGLSQLPTIGLAKEMEEIFQENCSEPLMLPRDSAALYLVARVRDEAHRFAITQHRRMRQTQLTVSVLDDISGIGEQRKKALLKHFGTVEKIKAAGLSELEQVPGLTSAGAANVFHYFRRQL